MYNNLQYSNLLKRSYTYVSESEKRVIDTNAIAAKRIQEHEEKQRKGLEGFVSGLTAPQVEIDALFAAAENEEENQGNVLKLQEDASLIVENANREAEEILAQARMQAMQLEKDARARAEQERMQMLEQARQQGMQEGMELAAQEAEKARQEYKAACRQMESEYQQLVDELEPQFVDTITDIYEHIFHVELRSYREILTHLIATTMRKVEGNRDFMIHVSKEDYPYISMQKKQIAAGTTTPNCSVEIVEDMTLSKNECFIETDGGIFDCGLGTQLSELRQKLMLLSFERKQ